MVTRPQKTFLAIVFIVLILSLVYVLTHKKQLSDLTQVVPTGTSQSTEPKVASLVSEKNETDYLSMDMTYPRSSVAQYPEMYTYIQKSKQDFLDNFGNISQADAIQMGIDANDKYTYEMGTTIATSSKTVTYEIVVSTYTGGAHGGTDIHTFTYDAKGNLVTLDDVFKDDGYLNKISTMARTYFYNTLDNPQKDMIDVGTEPKPENFSSWYLTDKTLTFIFGQYAVGPYVIGIQEFPIDKTAISGLLSPKFK